MKIGILDDELHCVESLLLHLDQLFPDIKVAFTSTDPYEALDLVKKHAIHLLFLDIQMPAMDGFEFLNQVEEIKFDVIFTTAYSEYAIQAFKINAINYLLKPISESDLKEAVQSYSSKIRKRKAYEDTETLINALVQKHNMTDKIAVPVSDGIEFIAVNDIIYCQSQSNYTLLFLMDNKKIMFSKTLKETENTMSKYGFLRIHQSYLINPNHMVKFLRNDGGFITMSSGAELPISNANRKLVGNYFEVIKTNR
ncbi:MAG TPA: LytTR family DNA-binding domain-containing protein [Chitinophagaceae bacterium]|nr:LytTR family DNA-binding domain-containing protein [Chitinophagaceae bacterium]